MINSLNSQKIVSTPGLHLFAILGIFSALLAVSGCTSNTDGGATTSPQTSSQPSSNNLGAQCSFTEIDQLSVATNPTQDFNAASAEEITTVQNSTCQGISNGVRSSETLGAVTRTNGQILFTDSGGAESVDITGSLATTPASGLEGCSDNVQVTGTLTNVELNPTSDQILISINWVLVDDNCTPGPIVSGQSSPAPVVIDPTSTPSPMPSP